MRIKACAFCLAGSLLLAACGGCAGGESSQAKDVRVTVERWLAALALEHRPGDNARACSYLTGALRKSIDLQLRMRGVHASCKTYAANWTGRSTPPGRPGAHVTAVVVAGRTARAML